MGPKVTPAWTENKKVLHWPGFKTVSIFKVYVSAWESTKSFAFTYISFFSSVSIITPDKVADKTSPVEFLYYPFVTCTCWPYLKAYSSFLIMWQFLMLLKSFVTRSSYLPLLKTETSIIPSFSIKHYYSAGILFPNFRCK